MAQFDGSTSVRSPSTTGLSDTKQLIIHFWFNWQGTAVATNEYILTNTSQNVFVRMGSNERLRLEIETSAGVDIIAATSPTEVFSASTGWTAVDIVIDTTLGNEFCKVFYDLVEVGSATPTSDALIDISSASWDVGARTGSTEAFEGDIDQLYISDSIGSGYINSAGLGPKYLAEMYDFDPDGVHYRKTRSLSSAVTQPFILLENDYTTFTSNNGSEGDFTLVAGALQDNSSTVPQVTWSYKT